MNKTPVMILQEVTMKCGILPTYTEISSNQINHQNQFTIGVKWKSYNAQGIGAKKKEAKNNAAKEMLLLLVSSGEISQSVISLVLNNGSPTTNITPTKSNTFTTANTSTSINKSHNFSNDSLISLPCLSACAPSLGKTFVNYVGLLDEYCVSRCISKPDYNIVNVAGPSHLPTFAMSCKVASLQEEASAATKQNAKHEVAKKMLQRLTDNTDFNVKHDTLETCIDKMNIQYMNLQISEPKTNNFKTEKVLATYKQRKFKAPVIKSQLQIHDYHQKLTNLCYNIPQIEKDSLINMYQREIFSTQNMSDLKNLICSALCTTAQTVAFKSISEYRFIIGVRLSTFPTIFEIGIGETTERAERQAVYKLLRLISVLLK